MTKERKFKKEYALELLRIAKNDFIAAETLAKNPQVRMESTFFLLQQVVEKALKAVLCAQEKMVPLVHDLALLMDRLEHPLPNSEEISELSDFASVRRYEEGTFVITQDELQAASLVVKQILVFCESTIDPLFPNKSGQ